jgi:hypothetical protein
MKLFKFGLRLWIMLISVMSFLMGWIMIAHAPKPIQSSAPSTFNATPIPTLAPLPNADTGIIQNNGNLFQSPQLSVQPLIQALPQSSNNFAPAPIFRTSGS